MRYTVLIDDPRLPRVQTVGADTFRQARDELRAHLRAFPESTNVVAEVGEPGDDVPRRVYVATIRGIRSLPPARPIEIREPALAGKDAS